MKPAYCIALLYIDLAVSALPTFYGFKDDLTRTPDKREAWPCKSHVKADGWSHLPSSKPDTDAVLNSMYKIVKTPCNHRHAVKEVKVADNTQKPEEISTLPQKAPQFLDGDTNEPKNEKKYVKQQASRNALIAADTHNKPATFWKHANEDIRKVRTFTNIVNTKIATPKLAHILPLWIPQRKYFKVRRDENLFLRNQKSNNLRKDRQLNLNLQFTILHGPQDFFNGENFNVDNFNVEDKVLSPWNRFSAKKNLVVLQKEGEKAKRQISKGSSPQANVGVSKRLFMTKKEVHKGGKFRKGPDVPFALYYRLPKAVEKSDKNKDLLRYLNEPSTAIYGPYVGTLRGDGGEFSSKDE